MLTGFVSSGTFPDSLTRQPEYTCVVFQEQLTLCCPVIAQNKATHGKEGEILLGICCSTDHLSASWFVVLLLTSSMQLSWSIATRSGKDIYENSLLSMV